MSTCYIGKFNSFSYCTTFAAADTSALRMIIMDTALGAVSIILVLLARILV